MNLQLYNFFHLNLAYSAIEEEERSRVIEQCYWPLLQLARRRDLPFGIELSGYTLECIAELDPSWVKELRSLITDGPCELIGCGYAQVIGPLVPHEATQANLRIGHSIYERLLGVVPKIALLNEQAFSAGMVPLYIEAGYYAIIMEWNNPARGHPDWDPEWRYLPQRACGPRGEQISLIWNKSIAFQKFQRYVHGELELEELLEYVRSHRSQDARAFPLYGNDVEIFDFRPGRYMTEAALPQESEWERIDKLYATLGEEPGMTFIKPSEVLALADLPSANLPLQLETAAQPVPVKKQDKYNLVRWAVSGRNDLDINTRCWALFEALKASQDAEESEWQELCYLWSSDFRTHITRARWKRYLRRLSDFEAKWIAIDVSSKQPMIGQSAEARLNVLRQGRFLEISGERLRVRLNCQRGLALDSLSDHAISDQPICGTLHHGFFDDIRWSADYYSGHLVFESPGRHKITDLAPVDPVISEIDGLLKISAQLQTLLGPIEKTWTIDDATGRLMLNVRVDWPEPVIGSLRLGHITLLPDAFDSQTLCYATHNGGEAIETFSLDGSAEVDHGRPISFLISASQAVGLTDGHIKLGDASQRVFLKFDKSQSALIGMVTDYQIRDKRFTRFALSAREVDDTSRPSPIGKLEIDLELGVSV